MYGSILTSVTRSPRASSNAPIDADATPFPSDDTTPPVTKMNFVFDVPFVMPALRNVAPNPQKNRSPVAEPWRFSARVTAWGAASPEPATGLEYRSRYARVSTRVRAPQGRGRRTA